MKALILNGSPRRGNTLKACEVFMENASLFECERIDLADCGIAPCRACGACGCKDGCVDDDDTNVVIDKMLEADFILFASPVYWFSVSAQMKLLIDKMYGRIEKFQENPKRIGIIAIGEDEIETPQYRIIFEQFKCTAEYLKWNIEFFMPISAGEPDDLAGNAAVLEDIADIAKNY